MRSEADSNDSQGLSLVRQQLPVSNIVADDKNRALSEDDEDFQTLIDSLRVLGVLQPVHVRKEANGTFRLIDGERRWRAAKLVGLTELPCQIWPGNTDSKKTMI